MLRQYPNLYADLSAFSALNAISRDPEFGKDFLLEFQDRLMFARDCFDGRLWAYLESQHLPADVLGKICAANALRLVPENT